MNDPLDRLRAQARARDDRFDDEAVLEEVRRRTDDVAPGLVTRRRRLARRTAAGVTGAGVVVVLALVVPGVVGPDGASSPGATGGTTVRDGIVRDDGAAVVDGTGADGAGGTEVAVVPAVSYAERARAAVDTVDLASLVLESRSTSGVQHPGDPGLDPGVTVEYIAGDGSASRWVSVQEPESWVGVSGEGMEEVHHVDPTGPVGQMTYWWASAHAGVYTRFTMTADNWDDVREGTIPEQLTSRLDELRTLTDEIAHIAAQEAVTVSGPSGATVAGRGATCFDLSGTRWPDIEGEAEGAWPGDEVVEWQRHTCFDDVTDLPLLDRRDIVYQLPDREGTSLSSSTAEYTWHPLDDASRALLQPGVDGLREVDRDTFVELTG